MVADKIRQIPYSLSLAGKSHTITSCIKTTQHEKVMLMTSLFIYLHPYLIMPHLYRVVGHSSLRPRNIHRKYNTVSFHFLATDLSSENKEVS